MANPFDFSHWPRTLGDLLSGKPAASQQPVTPQHFPPDMPFDAFGFLPPGVQLPGETTIAPMLREVQDMRRANQGMLRQIEADTFPGEVMHPRGVWEEPSVALEPGAPTQRTVRALPVGPPSGGSADPSRFEWETANAGTNPDQRLNDLTANAQQSHAESNVDLGPEQTTTTPVPWEGWQALSQAIMSSKPPRIGEGLDWSIAPSRPRRPKPQAQARPALPLPTMASMLQGA